MRQPSRRQFLKSAALVAGALAFRPTFALADTLNANSEVRLAIIGLRGKGADHINTFKKIPGVRLVALCDADQEILDRELKKLEPAKPDGYRDVREVLDRPDVDAVVIATPNHWHSLMAIWACQAGKDVYVEKPISHNIWEGRKLVEAAWKYRRIVQPGTQNRSDPALREAFAYLQSGQLGKIKLVRGFCYKRRDTIGKMAGPQPIPASVDYNLWCGPAPMEPLRRKSLHYDWHWNYVTGNGDIGNQGIHEMDLCRWVAGHRGLAPKVLSIGGRFGYEDDATTANTQIAYFDYPSIPILFEVRGLPMSKSEEGEAMDNYKGARIGVVVECENGYFSGGGGGGWTFDNSGKKNKQFAGPGGRDHQLNFIQAVRSRKSQDLNGNIEECHYSSGHCHLANISYRLGQKADLAAIQESLKANPIALESFERMITHLKANEVDLAKNLAAIGPALEMADERFVGVGREMANLLLKRDYREPFAIREQV